MAYERVHRAMPGRAVKASEQRAFLVAVFVCAVLVAYKFLVTTRLNISWDEFWQLHLLHLGARSELPFSLDSAHVWWLQWLASVAGQETNQIVSGRLAMVALLGLTTWLIWRTGR